MVILVVYTIQMSVYFHFKSENQLQLHSSHRSDGNAGMLEQQLTMTDQRVRRLDAEKRAAETRAEQAERRVRY